MSITISKFAGVEYLETDGTTFYRAVINKLGGIDVIRPCIPFDDGTLIASYQEDTHFNTPLTPLQKWSEATGLKPCMKQCAITYVPNPEKQPNVYSMLRRHNVGSISLSHCVSILKYAAEQIVNAALQKGTSV